MTKSMLNALFGIAVRDRPFGPRGLAAPAGAFLEVGTPLARALANTTLEQLLNAWVLGLSQVKVKDNMYVRALVGGCGRTISPRTSTL